MKEMLRRRRVSMRPAVGRWPAAACAALVSSLAILPLDARGGDCIDYGEFIHLVGSVDTPGAALGVAVAGTHAYVADGGSGLQVVDISNCPSRKLDNHEQRLARP